MNIYVVRHGQTDFNVQKRFQGHIDTTLNNNGIEQARRTASKFSGIKIDEILVSPLTRAKQTAQFISEVTGVAIKIEEGLIERCFGNMEGKMNSEKCNIQMLSDYDKNCNINNVETIQDLFKRIYSCMDNIIDKYSNKNIVLVTHGCVTQAIECYFNGIPEDRDVLALALKNCEIKKYNIEKRSKVRRL